MKQRYNDILTATITDLRAGIRPLSREFLVDHNVSFEECQTIADIIADTLEAFVRSPIELQTAMRLFGIRDADTPEVDEMNIINSLFHLYYTRLLEWAAPTAPSKGEK